MKHLYKILAGAACAAAGCYAGYVAITYARYGRAPNRTTANSLLDSLMPDYEVRDVHRISVTAPAAATLAAAREVSFSDSTVVRSVFALRALPARLSGAPAAPSGRRPILEEVLALGWREIGEEPGRQLVMGAVTQPWKQNVVFRGLRPEEFVAFDEPGYAKIAWTLEAEPLGAASSVFRTETRVSTTDPASREKFRRYWSLLSPGIRLIRYETLRLVRAEAERRAGDPGPEHGQV